MTRPGRATILNSYAAKILQDFRYLLDAYKFKKFQTNQTLTQYILRRREPPFPFNDPGEITLKNQRSKQSVLSSERGSSRSSRCML
jgi:hypothetical protein